MRRKIILSLLIQCGILFQAVGSLSETNSVYTSESWDRHVRKKRVIDITPEKRLTFLNQGVPYVILILSESGEIQCTGAILAPNIIITAAHCVVRNKNCFVESGFRRSMFAKRHQIVIEHLHEKFNWNSMKNDLALLVIKEPIDVINSYHRAIELFEGPLPPNSHGLVTGWGRISREDQSRHPAQAQSIMVDIISLQQCQHAYSIDPQVIITSHEICTHYVNRTKCCWFGDSGAPLVVDGHLVGIFSWLQIPGESIRFPDVFMNLLHPDYKGWVQNWVRHFRGLGKMYWVYNAKKYWNRSYKYLARSNNS